MIGICEYEKKFGFTKIQCLLSPFCNVKGFPINIHYKIYSFSNFIPCLAVQNLIFIEFYKAEKDIFYSFPLKTFVGYIFWGITCQYEILIYFFLQNKKRFILISIGKPAFICRHKNYYKQICVQSTWQVEFTQLLIL